MSRRKEADRPEDDFLTALTIVEERKLTRPNVTMRHVWACLFVLVVCYLIIGIVPIFIPVSILYKVLIFLGLFCLFSEFYLRFLAIILIKAYQHYASDEMRSTCHCVPSCSEYSIQVFKKYPLIVAFVKAYVRLNKTCDGSYKIDNP